MVGKECRKRPLFIIITTAANVTDRSLRSRKWGVGSGRICGEGWQDRWLDVDQRGIPRQARHIQFKDEGSRGSRSLWPHPPSEEDPAPCPARDPDPDSDPCIPESSSCPLLSPVQDLLVLPGSCWRDARAPAPNSRKLSIGLVYFALFLLLFVLLVLLVLLVKLFIFNL